jgi:hypothetical protein
MVEHHLQFSLLALYILVVAVVVLIDMHLLMLVVLE